MWKIKTLTLLKQPKSSGVRASAPLFYLKKYQVDLRLYSNLLKKLDIVSVSPM